MKKVLVGSFIWIGFTPNFVYDYLTAKGKSCFIYKSYVEDETIVDRLVDIKNVILEPGNSLNYMYADKNLGEFFDRENNDHWRHIFSIHDLDEKEYREDPILIALAEKEIAEGENLGSFRIVELPNDLEYYIHEDRGCESIHERHRSW